MAGHFVLEARSRTWPQTELVLIGHGCSMKPFPGLFAIQDPRGGPVGHRLFSHASRRCVASRPQRYPRIESRRIRFAISPSRSLEYLYTRRPWRPTTLSGPEILNGLQGSVRLSNVPSGYHFGRAFGQNLPAGCVAPWRAFSGGLLYLTGAHPGHRTAGYTCNLLERTSCMALTPPQVPAHPLKKSNAAALSLGGAGRCFLLTFACAFGQPSGEPL